MTTSPGASKEQITDPSIASSQSESDAYELLYWPTIPGRGEFIRLLFEATRTPYTDVCNNSTTSHPGDLTPLRTLISPTAPSPLPSSPPPLAPPILRHGGLLLAQTPNILLYLAPRLGLAGPAGDGNAVYHLNQLVLTALEGLSDGAHDTHHPVSVHGYYEDQKEEARRKAGEYLGGRLPKFLGYFERVLQGEASKGGEWLYGGEMTYADLVLGQCLDGVGYAFPNAVERLKRSGQYAKVFALAERVLALDNIKEYLGSERRQKYGLGLYRHYPELDAGEV